MIKFLLIRKNPENLEQNFTSGELFYRLNDNEKFNFLCYTLEDKIRDYNKDGDLDDAIEQKIYGETAIPFGIYNGILTYSNTFNRRLPLILNVKGFEGIRMHGGNSIADTLGCILIAHNTDNNGKIWGSAEKSIIQLIQQNDNKFTIEII